MGPTKKRPSRRLRARPGPRSVLCGINLKDFYYTDFSKAIFRKLAFRQPRDKLFEQEFYEGILKRRPGYVNALEALGHVYTELGDYKSGLNVDRKLARFKPANPITHYNLACSLSLLERVDEAFIILQKAINLGYSDFDYLNQDQDLSNLRADSKYREFLASLREKPRVS